MDVLGMDFKESLTLRGEDLLQACRELTLLSNRVSAMQTVLANRIRQESEEVPLEESLARKCGSRSTVDLVQWLTGESATTVRGRLRLGRQVGYSMSMLGEVLPPPLEHVSRGLADGHLAVESAHLIATMLTKLPPSTDPELTEYAQRSLVQAATGDDYDTGDDPEMPLHADKVRVACRSWENALDPDGPAPNEDEAFRKRFLNLGPVRNGLVNARGLLLPETAAALRAITDAVGNPRVEDSSDLSVQSSLLDADDTILVDSDSGSSTDVDMRTPEQRRHDALALALDVTLRSRSLPFLGGSHATITVEVDVKSGSQAAQVGWLRDHEGLATAISADAIKRISCGAAIQAVATDSMGRIRDLGSAARIFDAHQRRAIALRDQSCVITGCGVPPAWCEVHHVRPHSEGGPTHTDNGVLLCGFHHRTIDSSGWTITMQAGIPKVQAPVWVRRIFPQESARTLTDATEQHTPPDAQPVRNTRQSHHARGRPDNKRHRVAPPTKPVGNESRPRPFSSEKSLSPRPRSRIGQDEPG